MNFEQTGGERKGPLPGSGQPATPNVSIPTMFMTVFAIVVLIAAMLIVTGILAYPAWELLKLGWSVFAP